MDTQDTAPEDGAKTGGDAKRSGGVLRGVVLALFMLSLPVLGAFFMHHYGDRSVSSLFGEQYRERNGAIVSRSGPYVVPHPVAMPPMPEMVADQSASDDSEVDENPCDQYADQQPSTRYDTNLGDGGFRVYSAATWCAYNRTLAAELGNADIAADSIDVDGEPVTVEDCVAHLPMQTDGKNLYSRACSVLLRGGKPTVMSSDLYRLVFDRR